MTVTASLSFPAVGSVISIMHNPHLCGIFALHVAFVNPALQPALYCEGGVAHQYYDTQQADCACCSDRSWAFSFLRPSHG